MILFFRSEILAQLKRTCRPLDSFESKQTGRLDQGCQMVYFQTKKSQLGKKFQGLRTEKVDIFYGRLNIFH
jgi:hypothetical protein